jgi:hypothetical protein
VRDEYPEDIVGAAVFFAGDASAFVTGQSLADDGCVQMCGQSWRRSSRRTFRS